MCSLLPNLMSLDQKQHITLPQKITIQQEHHQQYALKWSDYQSSILHCFQRLLDEEDFVDVTLSCDQRTFAAHRIVLSACSPYFRKLLKSNPCKHPIVILRDVRSENMACLLSFMYNGEVNIRHDQLPDFLKTAHLLQVRGLTDVSENWYSSGCFSTEGKSIDSFSANETYKPKSDRDILEIESAERCNYLEKYKYPSERPTISNSMSTGINSPPLKDTKTSTTVRACLQWENSDLFRNRKHHITPPPQKRIKSADLFRAQHGISSGRDLSEKEFSTLVQQSLPRDRKEVEEDEINVGHIKAQKLPSQNQHLDIESMQEESSDEESNTSNDGTYDRDDKRQRMNDSMHQKRTAMNNILLGVPKPSEEPSVLNLNDFGMGISQDQATEAALHAAKMVQLNSIGQGFESKPSAMIHSYFNLSKEPIGNKRIMNKSSGQSSPSSEPILRQHLSCGDSISEHIQHLTSTARAENSSDNPKKDEYESALNMQNLAPEHQSSYREFNNFNNEVLQLEEDNSAKAQ